MAKANAKAKYQAKWRETSGKRKVEAYLHAETVARLDEIAADRGQSRAAVIAELIDAAGAESGAQAAQAARDANTADWVAEAGSEATAATEAAQAPPVAPEPEAGTSKSDVPTHKLRKAQGEAPDGGDAWAVYVEGARVGLAYRNTNPNEQRAPSVAWIAVCDRDATRKRYRYRTRTQAVEMMLKIERPHERAGRR